LTPIGAVYTPDWLADHVLDVIGWQPDDDLLDPTCGDGAFLRAALRRRLAAGADDPLRDLRGIDIDPAAVRAARAALRDMAGGDPAVEVGDALDATAQARFVVGNPPWVKWSALPREYAARIQSRSRALGVFGRDRWVGGIETDFSTVITHHALRSLLAPGGTLAFVLSGSVFANEASEGFRRFDGARVVVVEDYAALRPFAESVHATLLVLRRGEPTTYPVPYRVHRRDGVDELLAAPVPGTDAGPWLKGTRRQHATWRRIFGRGAYRARKGVTTDLTGAFFVTAEQRGATARITNDPARGRKPLPTVTAEVEAEHVFPLLRGRDLHSGPELHVLVPQRGMHGDPDLPRTAPLTHAYLERFRPALEQRSSLRRYQPGAPYWSLWNVGPYTFSPHKVVWREISGRFAATHVGPEVIVCDHKLYFVPCESEAEAHYLTNVLCAPTIAEAITAYAAQLSLGASVVEYLAIPRFDAADPRHREIAEAPDDALVLSLLAPGAP
jgi:RMKL-like, methyltransferase domain